MGRWLCIIIPIWIHIFISQQEDTEYETIYSNHLFKDNVHAQKQIKQTLMENQISEFSVPKAKEKKRKEKTQPNQKLAKTKENTQPNAT